MSGVDIRGSKGGGGFSLVEVLVSLTILSVGLLGLALFQISAIKGNASAMNTTVATQAAQAKLESFRRISWTSVVTDCTAGYGGSTTATVPVYASVTTGDNVLDSRGKRFYRIWRVVPNTPSALIKTITVWSCWQDELGAWHNVMLVALRTAGV